MHQPKKARVNISLNIETNGALKKKELPMKLLVLGEFSSHMSQKSMKTQGRTRVTLNNLDSTMAHFKPSCNVSYTLQQQPYTIQLQFNKLSDFKPESMVMHIPQLKQLLAIRHCLKELKANLLENKDLRDSLNRMLTNKSQMESLSQQLNNLPINRSPCY